HDVATPDMIRQLPSGFALVIRGGCAPVIARLPRAWRNPAYKTARRRGQATAILAPAPSAAAITVPSESAIPDYVPDDLEPGDGTRPPPRWWKLTGQARQDAVARLRAWVEQVYRPGYGQLAAAIGPCWEAHDLCLYALDIAAELWSVLYLQDSRNPAVLSAQA